MRGVANIEASATRATRRVARFKSTGQNVRVSAPFVERRRKNQTPWQHAQPTGQSPPLQAGTENKAKIAALRASCKLYIYGAGGEARHQSRRKLPREETQATDPQGAHDERCPESDPRVGTRRLPARRSDIAASPAGGREGTTGGGGGESRRPHHPDEVAGAPTRWRGANRHRRHRGCVRRRSRERVLSRLPRPPPTAAQPRERVAWARDGARNRAAFPTERPEGSGRGWGRRLGPVEEFSSSTGAWRCLCAPVRGRVPGRRWAEEEALGALPATPDDSALVVFCRISLVTRGSLRAVFKETTKEFEPPSGARHKFNKRQRDASESLLVSRTELLRLAGAAFPQLDEAAPDSLVAERDSPRHSRRPGWSKRPVPPSGSHGTAGVRGDAARGGG
ncbi:unnamed protein product [Lampetra fluviatilis]